MADLSTMEPPEEVQSVKLLGAAAEVDSPLVVLPESGLMMILLVIGLGFEDRSSLCRSHRSLVEGVAWLVLLSNRLSGRVESHVESLCKEYAWS